MSMWHAQATVLNVGHMCGVRCFFVMYMCVCEMSPLHLQAKSLAVGNVHVWYGTQSLMLVVTVVVCHIVVQFVCSKSICPFL